MSAPTIKDIAKQAGVSIATVSYVINKNRPVSPELTQRVLDAIAQLGYRPNEVARGLRQKRTGTVGLIVPDSANPFFAEIAKGVEDAGFEAGYNVILCNSNAMLERELDYLDLLTAKRVDGVIFFATTAEAKHLSVLIERGIPVVTFYRDVTALGIDTFRVDNLKVGRTATQHLIDLGHKHLACVRPLSEVSPSALRVRGFREALAEAGLAVDEALMPKGNNLIDGGRACAESLLASGRAFTAVYCGNDAMAIGAMAAFSAAGLRVPDDVSVAGTDDIALASYLQPPLTTVSIPKYEAGQQAMAKLIQRIEDGCPDCVSDIWLDTQLVVRKSTAPPKSDP